MSLLGLVSASPAVAAEADQKLLVKFRPGTAARGAADALARVGARELGAIPGIGVRVVRVAPDKVTSSLRRLDGDSRIAFAEADGTVEAEASPNDYWWPSEWAPPKVNAPAAWDRTVGSPATVIAVLDSGVDFSQPDLQGSFVAGRDVVNGDDDPRDDFGHGTQVAGVAAARSDNGIGVASYCWRCSVMPVKVLGANGAGSVSNLATGIVWASDHGARVINMSLGGTSASSTLASAVQYAHDRGAVLVASAGNSSSTTPTYPAALPAVLGVAGSDSTDRLTSTSNYGSWVQVAAPGCNFTTGLNSWFGTFCGTSSAAPVVAGIAGLAISLNPAAANTAVEQALLSSAAPASFVRYGRVDAAAALAALSAPSAEPPPAEEPPPPPPSGEGAVTETATLTGSISAKQPSRSFPIKVGSGASTATLTFGKASAMTLTLIAPDGSTAGTVSGGSGLQLTSAVSPGTYTYVVSGKVGKGSASFSLALSYPRG